MGHGVSSLKLSWSFRMAQWDKIFEQVRWANAFMRGTSPKFGKWSIFICLKVEKVSKSPQCWKEAWCLGRIDNSKYAQCSKLGRDWLLMFGISLMYKRGLMDESQSSVVKARNRPKCKRRPRVWKRPNVQSLEVGWCSRFTSRTNFQKRLMLRIDMMGKLVRNSLMNGNTPI